VTSQGEIRPGYKQTEVGVIPEDWTVSPLRDLVDPARGIRYGIVQPGPFVHNGRLLIRGQDYSKRWVDATEMYRVGDVVEARYKNARVAAGDLIITIVGASTGHVEEVPDWLDTANLTQTTARIAIDRRKAEPRFAKYILASSLGESHVANYVKGGAQPGLNCGDVEKFLIPHPNSVDEQRAIAAALADADGLIAALEGMIAKKRDLKQAAMQHLLTGKTRLPGFSGEWEVKRLGDVAEIVMGQSPASANYNTAGQGLPLIQGNADIRDRKTIRRVFTTQVTKQGRAGDLLMSVRAPVGEVALATFDCCLGRGVCAIRYPNWFLYHALIAKEPDWAKLSKGSTFDSVNSSEVRAFALDWPNDPSEQTAIAEVLSDMDADLAALEAQAAKARAVKQGMMQELLTGRVRLV
jgi:type I restriction enzyme, S subunit